MEKKDSEICCNKPMMIVGYAYWSGTEKIVFQCKKCGKYKILTQ